MEITVGASLAAKGNMNVKPRQFKAKFVICGQTRLLKKFFIAFIFLSLVQCSFANPPLRTSNGREGPCSDSTLPGDLLQSLRKQGFFAFRTQDSAIRLPGNVLFVILGKLDRAACIVLMNT